MTTYVQSPTAVIITEAVQYWKANFGNLNLSGEVFEGEFQFPLRSYQVSSAHPMLVLEFEKRPRFARSREQYCKDWNQNIALFDAARNASGQVIRNSNGQILADEVPRWKQFHHPNHDCPRSIPVEDLFEMRDRMEEYNAEALSRLGAHLCPYDNISAAHWAEVDQFLHMNILDQLNMAGNDAVVTDRVVQQIIGRLAWYRGRIAYLSSIARPNLPVRNFSKGKGKGKGQKGKGKGHGKSNGKGANLFRDYNSRPVVNLDTSSDTSSGPGVAYYNYDSASTEPEFEIHVRSDNSDDDDDNDEGGNGANRGRRVNWRSGSFYRRNNNRK